MNKDKQEQLFKEFPYLFRQRRADGKLNSPYWPIETGITCDDGWYNIIHDTCRKLDYLNKVENSECVVFQIKEKFGTLCFYVKNASEIQRDVAEYAGTRSSWTCEQCGFQAAQLRKSRRWIRTLCAQHAVDAGYTIEEHEKADVTTPVQSDI